MQIPAGWINFFLSSGPEDKDKVGEETGEERKFCCQKNFGLLTGKVKFPVTNINSSQRRLKFKDKGG